MSSSMYNFRMDDDLRKEAFAVIESYGLTPPQALKLFLKHIADTHTIPLSFQHHATRLPNAATRAAMREIERDREHPHLTRYASLDDMMQDIAGAQENTKTKK
ncbi:MAG: type II toxin-antitoxin system RelB/DinJ family antitoxin [Cardiobacteriaceae bacterium]|nr:type II toxin-antitoxin system RelB/DinJ family antitoxin [Cardiobacteriaceae bacterium]